MAVTVNAPVSWKGASGDDALMLDNLQPNILKPHVRDFLCAIFLSFTDKSAARALLKDLVKEMKSTKTHLDEITAFKSPPHSPGSSYVGLGLTMGGYAALGETTIPADAAFRAGMQANANLNDSSTSSWDLPFRDGAKLHAIVLIGDATQEAKDATHARIADKIKKAKGVRILGMQEGLGRHNVNGDGIEHFGYVDGRSQPLFLTEDIDAEMDGSDGATSWDPAFPLSQAIVPDLAAPDPNIHFGSYIVFRKLEQNVRKFKEQEAAFASRLTIDDEERAGAMLVGRFEDGTPVTLQFDEGSHSPVPNNFNYESDKRGSKCPFLGHIRKTNPRGSGGFGQSQAQERQHLMARRGQTYGIRTDNPNDGQLANKPEGGCR